LIFFVTADLLQSARFLAVIIVRGLRAHHLRLWPLATAVFDRRHKHSRNQCAFAQETVLTPVTYHITVSGAIPINGQVFNIVITKRHGSFSAKAIAARAVIDVRRSARADIFFSSRCGIASMRPLATL
jgi:hypothetical protein